MAVGLLIRALLLPSAVIASRSKPDVAAVNNKSAAFLTPAETQIKNIFGDLDRIKGDVQEEEMDEKQMRRKQTRYRLMKNLHNEVAILPHELQKLEDVFKSEDHHHSASKRPSEVHEEKKVRAAQKLAKRSRGKRAAKRLSQRRQTRHEDPSKCGARIPVSEMGIKRGPAAAGAFHEKSLLQFDEVEPKDKGPARPFAKPGIGSEQTLKDEGRSVMGNVKGEEPFVTVYKDGFWFTGCFKDKMFDVADQFGSNKAKFNKKMENVSIALYKELVLEDKQKPMSPVVCFEFCRSVKGMGFFGLQGDECYCTPFFEDTVDGVSSSDQCSWTCPGDQEAICGGKVKQSIFEMHLCGDRGQQLSKKAEASAEELSGFYAAVLFTQELSKDLQASGELLEEVAGLGGDSKTAEYGRDAKKFAGDVSHVLMDGECLDNYNGLLMTYEESEEIAFSDMTKADNLQKADDATTSMIAGMPKVKECTKKAEDEVAKGYPPMEQAMEAESDADMLKIEEDFTRSIALFHPLIYVLKSQDSPKHSTCHGELLGKPLVTTFAECAFACEDTIHPDMCVGFQFFHMGGHEDAGGSQDVMQPLCFMFKKFKSMTTYECDFVEDLTEDYEKDQKDKKKKLLLEQKTNAALRGHGEPKQLKETQCGNVQRALLYTGMTCDQLFGSDHSVKDTCSDVCDRTKAAMLASVCMVKLTEIGANTPNMDIDNKKRCFGGARNKKVDGPEGAAIHFLPFDDQGVVLSGDAQIGSHQILEPIIWTQSEDDEA